MTAPTPIALQAPPSRSKGERRARRAAAGNRPADRANRVTLTALGLVLVAAGAAALVAAGGSLHWDQPGRIYSNARLDASQHPDLWAAGACLACLIIGVAGLRWAGRQLTARAPEQLSGLVPLPATGPGATTVNAAHLARAIAADLGTVDGVESARAQLRTLDPPRLTASVKLHVDTEPDLTAMFDEPLRRAARMLGAEDLDVELRVNFGGETPAHRVS